MVTFIVYICALLPNNMQMYTITTVGKNSKRIGNLLVHIISPLLVVLDYFLYVYTYRIQGGRFYAIGGSKEFGYFFLDYRKMGIKGVVFCIIGIAIGIIVLGYVWVFIDKLLKQKKNK